MAATGTIIAASILTGLCISFACAALLQRHNLIAAYAIRGDRLALNLVQAGFSQAAAATVFRLTQAAGLFVCAAACSWPPFSLPIAAQAGFYAAALIIPHPVIAALKRRRAAAIDKSLPSGLSFLSACLQAGLPMDAALERTAKEMQHAGPELAACLAATAACLRHGNSRKTAFDDLSISSASPTLALTADILRQADYHGLALANALNGIAIDLRCARMAAAESSIAALQPKLSVPLILFFIPPLIALLLLPSLLPFLNGGY